MGGNLLNNGSSTGVLEPQQQKGKFKRRITLNKQEEKKTKEKNIQEEKELLGDVEGRSFFKCCYSRKHQDEDAESEVAE